MPSVTIWINQLQDGQESALGKIHARYWPKLVGMAARRMSGHRRSSSDEEDVAQQAFMAFYQRVRTGSPLKLDSRDDLLALLSGIIRFKALKQIEFDNAEKRGGGRVASLPQTPEGREVEVDGDEIRPEEEVIMRDVYHRYINALPDEIRPVAQLYLTGQSAMQISQTLGFAKRTAERKINRIIALWRDYGEQDLDEQT